jgi:nucleotide-binding universal stress UspA family protein
MKEGIKILVGFDGSEHATKALVEAAELAKKFKGSITVLTALHYEPADINVPGERVHDRKEMKELKELQMDVKNTYDPMGVKYEYVHDEGYDPGKMIIEHLRQGGYSLAIIGNRGIHDPSAVEMGSVSSKVANGAHCSVLIVR